MGLFDDYGIDPDEVPDGPSYEIEDGVYDFEVSEAGIWIGESEERGEYQLFFIDFLLGDEGKKKREFFGLPEDPSAPTEDEVKKLGFLKSRIMSLGFTREQVRDVEGDDLVGITGTLQLKTTRGRGGKEYQNIRNVRVGEEEPEAPKLPTKAGKAAPKATPKANVFAKAAKG